MHGFWDILFLWLEHYQSSYSLLRDSSSTMVLTKCIFAGEKCKAAESLSSFKKYRAHMAL